MSFCTYKSWVALCNNEQVVISDLEDESTRTIHLPELRTDKKIDSHNNADVDSLHSLTSLAFSGDGKYFLVCTNRKQLCLYETKDLKLLSSRSLVRAASKVRFTPNNDIIVADKAGDAYVFSRKNPMDEGALLLGHLSMLLDVLVTDDGKYILTTDRDEKIRVSMFPNSYNIAAYCLGHTKFVTSISELSHEKSVLVSAGGDGTLKLWDHALGEELLSFDFHDKLSKEDVEKFNKELEDCHLEERVQVIPVKHLRTCKLKDTTLIILSFYSNPLLLIYNVQGNKQTGFKIAYLQSLELESEPIECILDGSNCNLWILTYSDLRLYSLERSHSFKLNMQDSMRGKMTKLNSLWEKLKVNTLKQQDLFPILYKRKYDNVQEYLERKKLRLGNVVVE